jgi:glycosyltransferase involved in cell wall biosynthesis
VAPERGRPQGGGWGEHCWGETSSGTLGITIGCGGGGTGCGLAARFFAALRTTEFGFAQNDRALRCTLVIGSLSSAMSAKAPLISVVIPVFNEAATLRPLVERLQQGLQHFTYEIILVDDGSTDGTTEHVRQLRGGRVAAYFHARNQGKGAALRTALQHVHGDVVVIQDADLEYDPDDIPKLIQPIIEGHADVVFGTRFHGPAQRIHLFWHRVANNWLTCFSNFLNNLDLSDMETGYKAFRKDVLDRIRIRENGFGVEPELTAKAARLKCRIYEVPVSYYGRDYAHGKKIGAGDAIWAAWCIIRYRIAD